MTTLGDRMKIARAEALEVENMALRQELARARAEADELRERLDVFDLDGHRSSVR